jgi:Metal binding domain of Ada
MLTGMPPDLDWATWDRARLARDPAFDGVFFMGVRTTRVYCRPVCPVRPARSQNVVFFRSAAAAERAGLPAVPALPAGDGTGKPGLERNSHDCGARYASDRGRLPRRSLRRGTCRAPGHRAAPSAAAVSSPYRRDTKRGCGDATCTDGEAVNQSDGDAAVGDRLRRRFRQRTTVQRCIPRDLRASAVLLSASHTRLALKREHARKQRHSINHSWCPGASSSRNVRFVTRARAYRIG